MTLHGVDPDLDEFPEDCMQTILPSKILFNEEQVENATALTAKMLKKSTDKVCRKIAGIKDEMFRVPIAKVQEGQDCVAYGLDVRIHMT